MSDSDIVKRVERYFERQIAWLEDAVAAMHTVEDRFSESALDALERQQAGLARQTDQFTHECDVLLREWEHAEGISEAARAAVRARAARAVALIAELQLRYEEAASAAGGRLAELRKASAALRRGRDALQAYRPGGDEGPGFVDRKA